MTLLELASRIGYQDVRDYLRGHGWHERPSKRDYVAIYRHAEPAAEALVPLDRDLGDYASAMLAVAREVASVEKREADSVVRDLSQPRRDLVRFSLEGVDNEGGTIGLAAGVSFLTGVRKALLASASTVGHPKRYHPRMSFAEAENYVEDCRLGQTEVGSYVLTVEAPHKVKSQLATAQEDFGRQATSVLMKSVNLITVSVRKGNTASLLEESHPLVSANLCDALVEMMPSNESADLRLRTTWSPLLATPIGIPTTVHVDRNMYEPIEKLAEDLRPKDGPRADRFVGIVVELSGGPGPTGEVEGDVVLQLQLPGEAGSVRARLTLGAAQYREAIQAHLSARFVLVRGVLHRGGRRLAEITNPQDFTTVGDGGQ